MGLSAYLPILAAAGAGHARGKFNRQMIDREDMKDALVEHHRKTLEENERRRMDNQDRDRRDVLQFRMDDAAERAKDRDADREERRQDRDVDRAERAREADQRAATSRQNRANTSSKPPAALNQDLRRQQFIDHRRTELMKSAKGRFNKVTPGMDAQTAQQKAAQEADEVFGPAAGPAAGAAPAPPAAARSQRAARDNLAASRGEAARLRARAEEAIANGADPSKVRARLEQKLRELNGAPASPAHQPSPE